jgi:hypothetical protein
MLRSKSPRNTFFDSIIFTSSPSQILVGCPQGCPRRALRSPEEQRPRLALTCLRCTGKTLNKCNTVVFSVGLSVGSLFPTCQVRVVRFYVSCPAASSSASSAAPPLQALDRSVPRRTRTASSGSFCRLYQPHFTPFDPLKLQRVFMLPKRATIA